MVTKMKKKVNINSKRKNTNSLESEDTKVIKIGVIVLLFLAIFYIIAAILNNEISFANKNKIDYKVILASDTFTKANEEYYVIFCDFSSSDKETIDELAKDSDISVYKVNVRDILNSYVLSATSNKKASSVAELKINSTTLISIKNGKNINYIEGIDNIKELFE